MKNANTLELKNAWVCEVMDLPPLIVMGNKKQGVSSKDKGRPFWTHDTSKSSLTVPIQIRCPGFPSLLAFG